MKLNTKNITVAIFLAMTLLFAACGSDNGDKVTLDQQASANTEPANEAATEETDNSDAEEIVEVEFGTVVKLAATNSYTGVGSFEAKDEVTVSPKVGGTIISMPKEEGDIVGSKSVIALLDKEDFELSLKNAKAQLKIAEVSLKNAHNEYNRKKKLVDDGAIPVGQFDAYVTQLELAQAQVAAAKVAIEMNEKAIRDTTTYAGVSGVISNKMMAKGEFIGAGDPMLTVSILDPIKLNFSIPQNLAASVVKGNAVKATISAFPGKVFKGKISLISPNVDARTRSILVEAVFSNADNQIKPGFFAEYNVDLLAGQDMYIVPNAAIFETEEGNVVKVVSNSGSRTVQVFTVESLGDESRVVGELADGEKLELK